MASEPSKKMWGDTCKLVDSPFYSLHKLNLEAGGYCSLHYHKARANRFSILSGQVEIVEMYGPQIVRTMLGPDNHHDVPSLVVHMFIVHKAGVMVEEYYPDRGGVVSEDDIIRIVEGGKLSVSELHTLPILR